MRIFGRTVRLSRVVDKSIDFLRMIIRSLIFENRIPLLKAYIRGHSEPNAVVVTKDGFKIHLSSNPHDIITLMVIFCRREYGPIQHGGIVIDIGANIGLFSIYAAQNGAKKVYAFEPNHQAYLTLCKSIEANGLGDIIKPFNLAVSSKDNDTLLIPRISSPYNSTKELSEVSDQRDFEEVKTISLPSILASNNIVNVDLLKMDCEGAEYDILYNLSDDHFSKIRSIRLEHHKREQKEYLINFLKEHQYEKEFDHNIILWFKKQTKSVL
jgi:FkbM family methyltransferase